MKKKIVFIHFNRFLYEFDWKRYEFDLLSKKFEIKVHVLINIVHPHLKNSQQFAKLANTNVVIFKNINEWKNSIRKIEKDTLFVFQSFPYNFAALLIYYYVKRLKFCTSIIFMNNLPANEFKKSKNNIFNKIWRKILVIYYRPKHSLVFYKRKFIFWVFIIFPKIFSPNHCFSSGLKMKKFKFSKLIRINSWDFSRTLRNKIINKKKNSYILYISDGESRYESDSTFYNARRTEDKKAYLKLLNKFFDKIEKNYKKKIIIASHPRGNPNLKYDREFKYRRSYYNLTYELVKNAKFIIALNSTSLSYAIIEKKKIMFIYSSSQQKISEISFGFNFSRLIKSPIINIDTYDNLDKKFKMSVDVRAYESFKKKYLISASPKQNFLFFSKAFM
jgi:hypothetical protein